MHFWEIDVPKNSNNNDHMMGTSGINSKGNIQWCSYFGGSGDEDIAAIKMDPESQIIYVAGGGTKPVVQSTSDYCNIPTNGDFPLCNSGGTSSYMETDIDGDNQRAFIASFSSDLTPKWITEFGDGNGSASTGLSISGDKLFVIGFSNEDWTEWEYDSELQSDHYLEHNPTDNFANDACIARFGTSQLVGVDENKFTNEQSSLRVYPNPTGAAFSIAIGQLHQSQTLTIYDALGEIVYSQKVNSQQQIQMNAEKLSSGIYIIALNNNLSSSVRLIVK